jgi:hypothetical protein
LEELAAGDRETLEKDIGNVKVARLRETCRKDGASRLGIGDNLRDNSTR